MFGLVLVLTCLTVVGTVHGKDAGTDAEDVNVGGRIVGGQNADIREHPHMLLMRRDGFAVCGAVVIGSTYAVTAAHCVYPLPDLERITLHGGSTTQTGMNVTFHVISVQIHPNYDDSSTNNDVAIIGVSNPFTEYPNIAPIEMQDAEPTISAVNPTNCHTTGWGLINRQPRTVSNTLQVGFLRLVPQRTCRVHWYPNAITTSMICAEGESADACSGDSGGPLVCAGRLYGIVSWGTASCDSSKAAVFTKIPAYTIRTFIRSNTGIYPTG